RWMGRQDELPRTGGNGGGGGGDQPRGPGRRNGPRTERGPGGGLRGERPPRVDRAERPSFQWPRGERPPVARERPSPRNDVAREPLIRSNPRLDGRPMPGGNAFVDGGGRGPLIHRSGGDPGSGRGVGDGENRGRGGSHGG